jgi:hypothetical protein
MARIKGLVYIEIIDGHTNPTYEAIFRECDQALQHAKELEIILMAALTDRRLTFEEWKIELEMLLAEELHPLKRSMLIMLHSQVNKEIFKDENIKYDPAAPLPPIHIDHEPDTKENS